MAPPRPRERRGRPDRATVFGWIAGLSITAGLAALAIASDTWGHDIWSGIAPDWPGGGYGFAVTVGGLLPVTAAAAILPLTLMNWKESRARSCAWAAASLPGAAASAPLLLVIAGAWRPKSRHRGLDCYSEGGPCWVHEQYPYVWAVGLAATLVGAAVVSGAVFLYLRDNKRSATARPATRPSTSEPPDPPPPGCPSRT
ncbi:hypothetical protein [Streptomyces sp. NBC_00564]|uniref:hypothetical protein n=1 Tax=Streptomyces sp. NBC_00564 TaxID=2903663 RepID=UPI00352FA0A8|nr:hypothetical protein OG256_26555 [Streptomyces sp. NBC_00564]